MMAEITLVTILAGLKTKDCWVHRAVSVLADHPSLGVIERRKLQEYRDELRHFGKIDPIDNARALCIPHAQVLLQVATAPTYDFKGKTFVLTGKLQGFTRTQLTNKLEGFGAMVSGSVSRRTDVVIVGTKPGAKLTAATRYGTPTWTEDELVENMKIPSKK